MANAVGRKGEGGVVRASPGAVDGTGGAARPIRSSLPVPLTSFVGREGDQLGLVSALEAARLVTLTGAGGVGKSRLAVEVATHLAHRGQAVAFVDLAPLSPDDAVVLAVASAVGVTQGAVDPGGTRGGRSLSRRLVDRLRGRELLVVWDDCEHVVGQCAELARSLLGCCEDLRILAVSRGRLGVAGEVAWQITGLSLPCLPASLPTAFTESDAVRLFCERAAAVKRGFVPTSDNVGAIGKICRRLEGLPLAIELAAAHVDALSPADIAAGLDHRLTLLVGGDRAGPARHETLRAALEWSEDLLAEPERMLLARLSIFPGDFGLDAAREVCAGGAVMADALPATLSALVAKSLVLADTTGRAARYRLPETVRAHASTRLGQAERATLAARHAAWAVTLVEQVTDPADGQQGLVDRLEAEQDNVRAALEWTLAQGSSERALRLAAGQMRLWERRGHYREARRCLDTVLAAIGDEAPEGLRAAALHDAGFAAMMLGEFDAAHEYLHESIALWARAGNPAAGARTRGLLQMVATFSDDALSVDALEDDLEQVRATGDLTRLAEALLACGLARLVRGEPARSRVHFDEAVQAARRAGHDALAAAALAGSGSAALEQGAYADAESQLHEGLALTGALGDTHTQLVVSNRLAELAARRGDAEQAQRRFAQCLSEARSVGAPVPLARSLLGLGQVRLEQGAAHEADRLLAEATAVASDAGLTYLVAEALLGRALAATQRGEHSSAGALLGQALTVAGRSECKATTATCLHHLGDLARRDGELRLAASRHDDALALREEIGDQPGVADSLEALAGLAVEAGTDHTAARLFGAARALRDGSGYARPRADTERYHADVASLQERMGPRAMHEAGALGAALTPRDAVRYARGRCGRGTETAKGWDDLSRAERAVAALVVQGLSNADIAATLVKSVRTVENQVSAILSKVGVKSRVELIRQAVRL